MSFLTIAPIDTSLGNFISFSGWPIIGEVSNASTDITSPNSSIIEWTASTCPFLINCKIDETVIHNNIKIVGHANFPGLVSRDASSLYSKNIFNFLSLIIKKNDNKIHFNWDDEIIKEVVLTHNGDLKLKKFA